MSWFEPAANAPFGVHELPYGIYRTADAPPTVGVALGDQVIDVAALERSAGRDHRLFARPDLNDFLAAGPATWAAHRERLRALLAGHAGRPLLEPHLRPLAEVTLQLPFAVADYVDFYASEQHATNLGRMFRPDSEPLTPNWRHLPIGYHGRAGTVVVSGAEVVRPSGQRKAPSASAPVFGPTAKLDFEAELGFVVGVGSERGVGVPTEGFAEHVFGVVIVNDWSARDLQAWEYVPLGPLLGKSFATSISAWVLPLAALDGSRCPLPGQVPPVMEYLQPAGDGFDIDIDVYLNGEPLSSCPYATMYYSPAQLLAHLTVNGASLRTGDLLGSGTISGPAEGQWGSLIELSRNGTQPVELANGSRTFLLDGDEVVMRGSARSAVGPVRLGEVRGRIIP